MSSLSSFEKDKIQNPPLSPQGGNSITQPDQDSPPKAKKKPEAKEPKPKKDEYGPLHNVRLTEAEFTRLMEDFGQERGLAAINFLDSYIAEKGYKSKEHNLSIRRWVIKAIDEAAERNRSSSQHAPLQIPGQPRAETEYQRQMQDRRLMVQWLKQVKDAEEAGLEPPPPLIDLAALPDTGGAHA